MPSALEKRRILERLRLLSATSAGLEAIAGPACEIARDLIGAAAASVFWIGDDGLPAGFYHDSAPVGLKNFFIENLDALFSRADQFNMVSLIGSDGQPIGQMLGSRALDHFHRSNVYKYLCQPLRHDHCLDLRVDRDGKGVAVLALWNPLERPFNARHVAALEPVREQLLIAVKRGQRPVNWRTQSSRSSHLICSHSGRTLISIDQEAEFHLCNSHLLKQGIALETELRVAPLFCQQLAHQLAHNASAEVVIPVANGRLLCTGSYTQLRSPGDPAGAHMFVAVDFQTADHVTAVEYVCGLPLTFMQKQIALFAMHEGKRFECEERFGVSAEALKKHLKIIFDATGVNGWHELRDWFLQS